MLKSKKDTVNLYFEIDKRAGLCYDPETGEDSETYLKINFDKEPDKDKEEIKAAAVMSIEKTFKIKAGFIRPITKYKYDKKTGE